MKLARFCRYGFRTVVIALAGILAVAMLLRVVILALESLLALALTLLLIWLVVPQGLFRHWRRRARKEVSDWLKELAGSVESILKTEKGDA